MKTSMKLSERDVWIIVALTSIFTSSLIIANIVAGIKIANIFGFILPAGFLAYAITFPITDVVDEVYGRRLATYIVWAGFIANITMLLLIGASYIMPPLNPGMQKLYAMTFNVTWRIVLASMIAYLISQHHDVWAFLLWKRLTNGKWLWLRNNMSTITSQLMDTVLFITIAFYGIIPLNLLLQMVMWQWLWKAFIALCDTPFVYLGVWLCKGGLKYYSPAAIRTIQGK